MADHALLTGRNTPATAIDVLSYQAARLRDGRGGSEQLKQSATSAMWH